jgi:hypothetical protein
MRIAGMGHTVGMTLPQIMALSSVIKDVGLRNESGVSAFVRIFGRMAREREKFAVAAGVDAQKFADAFRRSARRRQMLRGLSGNLYAGHVGHAGPRELNCRLSRREKFLSCPPGGRRRDCIRSESFAGAKGDTSPLSHGFLHGKGKATRTGVVSWRSSQHTMPVLLPVMVTCFELSVRPSRSRGRHRHCRRSSTGSVAMHTEPGSIGHSPIPEMIC